MKKLLKILTMVAAVLTTAVVFATCKQFRDDPEEFLRYWSSEVAPIDFSIDVPVQTSTAGTLCIPSSGPVTLTIKLRNPRNFTLVMPTSSANAGKVIDFPGLLTQPVYGTDYTLNLTANDTLKLTYKQAFLQAHEWSNGNIGPEITLMSTDGRKFSKKFRLNLKADTAPALKYEGIGKTATADSSGNHFYVLLFRAKDMGTMIGSQSVHKDINTMNITAGGVSLSPITLSVTGTEFTSSSADLLATASPLDAAHPLPTGSGLLRLKTDVKVGGAAKEYAVSIKDEQGLSSAVIRASTQKNKLPKVKLFDNLTEITGTSESSLKEFSGTSGKTLTATVAPASPAGTAITGSIAKYEGGTWTQISGGTVSGTTTALINLPALGTDIYEERYKITLKAQLSGYDDSDPEDFFIKLVKYEVPVLKIKQDFQQTGDYFLYCISAGTRAYVTEDIIPDAGQYNDSENSLVIYSMLNGKCKLELSADAGTTVKYKLDGTEYSSSAPAEITVSGGAHTLEVWTVRGATEGPHTTVHIKVVNAVSSYGELKNLVKNAPEKGTGQGQYYYSNYINIKIGSTAVLTADSEIAVTGGKKLMLSSSSSGTVRTINANNSGRIFKISGTGTGLILENIKLEGGFAADGKGGAVCVEAGCTLELTEKTVITPSTAPYINTKGKNDVYLASGTFIKVDGALTSANHIVARITPEHYTHGIALLHGGNLLSTYTRFSVTQPPDAMNLWTIKNDGTLKAIPTIINGGSGAWQRLKEAVEALPEGSTITINGTITATNTGAGPTANWGEIIITKNLTIQGTNKDSDILDANSAGLSTNAHRIFTVENGKTLTLKKLTLKNGQPLVGKSGGAILVQPGCTANLFNCIIEGCKTGTGGSGGAMSIWGTANLTSCTVKKCVAEKNGGGLYVYGGNVMLVSTTIGGSEAGDGNKAADGDGGGIYFRGVSDSDKISKMTGGKVSGNYAKDIGGGIFCISVGRFYMTSGEISGNTGDKGGGVGIVGNNSYFYMKGGTISKNSASDGGGVFVNGIFEMEGKATVTLSTDGDENKAGKNDVYLFSRKSIFLGSLDNTVYVARITPENYNEGIQVLKGTLGSSQCDRFRVTPKSSQQWYVFSNGKLKRY